MVSHTDCAGGNDGDMNREAKSSAVIVSECRRSELEEALACCALAIASSFCSSAGVTPLGKTSSNSWLACSAPSTKVENYKVSHMQNQIMSGISIFMQRWKESMRWCVTQQQQNVVQFSTAEQYFAAPKKPL